ncbi:hypothetical protein AWRI1631_131110 [Saccharomyces cerevisiae AWRI1631]|uniref:Uncharacterized protein n=1 Tax=Saccharomyces cerevisiae (strain AWRI1631) TaxID=545124 RepID=B5VPA1_YEAS6|nr:hypothetical protein AWRI1631_131110 [Saccharomyces cerevisiae AWRI1631]
MSCWRVSIPDSCPTRTLLGHQFTSGKPVFTSPGRI